jgi:hypothetical protein
MLNDWVHAFSSYTVGNTSVMDTCVREVGRWWRHFLWPSTHANHHAHGAIAMLIDDVIITHHLLPMSWPNLTDANVTICIRNSCLPYAFNNSRMAGRIFVKCGIDVVPWQTTRNSCFLKLAIPTRWMLKILMWDVDDAVPYDPLRMRITPPMPSPVGSPCMHLIIRECLDDFWWNLAWTLCYCKLIETHYF